MKADFFLFYSIDIKVPELAWDLTTSKPKETRDSVLNKFEYHIN